jgi:hypothetical protein
MTEVPRKERSPKEFRKFRFTDLDENIKDPPFYYVHESGYVVIGTTLMTANRTHRDILKDMAKYEYRLETFKVEVGK